MVVYVVVFEGQGGILPETYRPHSEPIELSPVRHQTHGVPTHGVRAVPCSYDRPLSAVIKCVDGLGLPLDGYENPIL